MSVAATDPVRFANGEFGDVGTMGDFREDGYTPSDTNYTGLLDDLVAEASHSWTKKQYMVHSMVNGIVRATDSAGRPARINSMFSYYVPNGERGLVTLTFKAGLPDCLYFDDDPQTCRAASPRIVSDYLKNKYAAE